MPLLSTMGAATARVWGSRGVAAPPAGPSGLEAYFTGEAVTATMGISDSVTVFADYDSSGQDIDSISFQVRFNGGTAQQWAQADFSAADTALESSSFNSSDTGWSGYGTYTFFCVARRTSSGVYDVVSDNITLTVS